MMSEEYDILETRAQEYGAVMEVAPLACRGGTLKFIENQSKRR
jgi:hypothetical protein